MLTRAFVRELALRLLQAGGVQVFVLVLQLLFLCALSFRRLAGVLRHRCRVAVR